jgi:hypothetical protein
VKMQWGPVPGFSEKMSTLSSTGWRGCTSPPKMHTVWSMTETTCEDRRSLSSSRIRVQVPCSVLIGARIPLRGIVIVISGWKVSEDGKFS